MRLYLVQYKSWFIPKDPDTYNALRDLGFPSTRIHDRNIDVLKLILAKAGHKATVVPFGEVYEQWLDECSEFGSKYGECKVGRKKQKYIVPNNKKGNKIASRIRDETQDFWARWGLYGEVSIAERKSTLKVICTVGIGHKPPVLYVKDKSAVELKPTELVMGNSKLSFVKRNEKLYWFLYTKQGDGWFKIREGQCAMCEIGNTIPLCSFLMDIE